MRSSAISSLLKFRKRPREMQSGHRDYPRQAVAGSDNDGMVMQKEELNNTEKTRSRINGVIVGIAVAVVLVMVVLLRRRKKNRR